ncbi:MAG: RidA family protein [Chloroflexota bacterium]|nr:RidA family protein [Chloroflexota bacterium]
MARRQVIEIPGLHHGANPIPVAVKIGSVLYTGGINPVNPETGETPGEAEAQIAQAFANARRIVEAAGGSMADIAKVDVRLKDMSHREALNREWSRLFPDAHDRPVRHTTQGALPGSAMIQMELVAHLA